LYANATCRYVWLIFAWSHLAFADLDDLDQIEESSAPTNAVSPPSTPTTTEPGRPTEAPPIDSTSSRAEKPNAGKKPRSQQSMKVAPEDPETAKKQPIRLKSKGLKAQKDGGIVELLDDVLIVQGDLKLQSDYAKVFFDEKSNEVSKAEAQGRVIVQRDSSLPHEKMTAKADKALFLNDERRIIFTGNASVNRNGSILKGKKIFYDMKTGWITFEGAEGLMQPGAEPTVE
jgi:lipopolysaccharide transport protein LptA